VTSLKALHLSYSPSLVPHINKIGLFGFAVRTVHGDYKGEERHPVLVAQIQVKISSRQPLVEKYFLLRKAWMVSRIAQALQDYIVTMATNIEVFYLACRILGKESQRLHAPLQLGLPRLHGLFAFKLQHLLSV